VHQQDPSSTPAGPIKVAIHPRLIQQIEEQDCFWLDRQAAVNTFIKLGLDSGLTLIKPSAPQAGPRPYGAEGFISTNKEVINKDIDVKKSKKEKAPLDPFKTKQLNPDLVPGDLLDVQQLLPEWWAVKKGVRSEGVFNRVCKALRGMTPEDRRTCLERATSGAWANIYEPSSTPTQSAKGGQQGRTHEQFMNDTAEMVERIQNSGLI
jgi:hypothetical protein